MSEQVECNISNGWNCYWSDNESKCSWCTHNQSVARTSKPEAKDHYVTHEEKVSEFYDYLTKGEVPEGVTCKSPKLTQGDAFHIIWFLQEITRCLPDTIEKCEHCGALYDSNCEGQHIDGDWEWKDEDVIWVMPKEYQGCYHDECVPFRECIPKRKLPK